MRAVDYDWNTSLVTRKTIWVSIHFSLRRHWGKPVHLPVMAQHTGGQQVSGDGVKIRLVHGTGNGTIRRKWRISAVRMEVLWWRCMRNTGLERRKWGMR